MVVIIIIVIERQNLMVINLITTYKQGSSITLKMGTYEDNYKDKDLIYSSSVWTVIWWSYVPINKTVRNFLSFIVFEDSFFSLHLYR